MARGNCSRRQFLRARQVFAASGAPQLARVTAFPSGTPRALAISAMILDRTAGALERYMDLLSARQRLVASNIANADTPGYKTRDLAFRGELQSLLSGEPAAAVELSDLAARNDGNNVSIDREARLLAENALRFNLASNLMRSEIRAVRSAIQEGRSG